MTLREAIGKASVLVIDGELVNYFSIADEGKQLIGDTAKFAFHAQQENQEWFLNDKGLRQAIHNHDRDYWETACGIIQCFKLISVMDAEELGLKI